MASCFPSHNTTREKTTEEGGGEREGVGWVRGGRGEGGEEREGRREEDGHLPAKGFFKFANAAAARSAFLSPFFPFFFLPKVKAPPFFLPFFPFFLSLSRCLR